ncbi:hypothetical protein JQN72_05540 [Phycicoccus sp. CSK15P-2]|uniref:hypothetical protein n=1 Tax=Phycicoccus sp. CSK15P-2 TaxID=2807627 RepID=UPI001950174E|nr:hypothetical protein [Phycicoccus sp. CSK15P-2]MBM6403702.1 hypothetical protein [Phycicoccus sp. CSK15P-2]
MTTPAEPTEPVETEDALEAPPETGDIVVDAALRDLAAVPDDALDDQLEAGEHVQRTLRSRLGDLGS